MTMQETYLRNSLVTVFMREWQRMSTEPSRLAGVFLQPLVFLLIFGLGFHDSFVWKERGVDYTTFFFPGIVGLVVLFSSIYATLTLVEDKRCGFFKLVLIAPGGILGALLGKIVATASLGFAQSLCFFPMLLMLPIKLSSTIIFWMVLLVAIGAITFATLGVLFAWLSPSASAFHALMSVILVPMWLLSGAMFPLKGMFSWISVVNPMSYLVQGLRGSMLAMADPWPEALVLLLFIVVLSFMLYGATRRSRVKI